MVRPVMATIYTKGDLFNTDGIRAYAFATNAEGTMDTGIAVAIKKKFPGMADTLKERAAKGALSLGDVISHKEKDETVFALVLQEAETKKATLAALTKAVGSLVEIAKKAGHERVGMAHPGTGRAALEWPRVKSILTEIGDETDVALVVFEQFIRTKKDDAAKADAKTEEPTK
jgi:O-acetyl-ADP-ribose deacetylase (regulator of RNase III)